MSPDYTRERKPARGVRHRSTFHPSMVIVANFWFTGCGPCKAEIPVLNKLAREFAGKDVVFLAFSTDEDDAMSRRFLKEYRSSTRMCLAPERPPRRLA